MLSLLAWVVLSQGVRVPFKYTGEFGGGVVSREGGHQVINTGAIAIIDLRSGEVRQEHMRTFIAAAKPPRAVSTLASQWHIEDALLKKSVSSAPRGPTIIADVLNGERILTVTTQAVLKKPSLPYHVLTEVRLDRSGEHANIAWVARHPAGSEVTPVAARFVGSQGVAMWELVRRPGGWDLEKYTGDRRRPGYDLKRAFRIRTGLPQGIYNTEYLPETSTVVYRRDNDWGGLSYFRTTLKGDVLGGVDLLGFQPRRNPSIQALWELTIPAAVLPGGNKDSWIPISRSADLSLWILKSPETGESFLFRLGKQQ